MAGNGNEVGEPAGDEPHNWLGRGLIQLTHRVNLSDFANYIQGNPNLHGLVTPVGGMSIHDTLLANPELISDVVNNPNARMLSALAGTWYWNHRSINAAADQLAFDANQPTERGLFNAVSALIGAADHDKRWSNYERGVMPEIQTGGNSYESMVEALRRLGITASGARDYQSQFGINLAPRQIVGIASGSSHLIAGTEEPIAEAAVLSALVTQAQQSFELTEGEYSMFIVDMPAELQQPVEMYVVANADTAQQGNEVESYKMGVCQVINREADIFPTGDAKDFMLDYVSPEKYPLFTVTRTDIDIQIIEPPQHGYLVPETTDPDNFRKNRYKYYADEGFVGTERFVFNVSVEGVTVQIHYELNVNYEEATVYGMTGDGYEPCPEYSWKISFSIDVDGNPAITTIDSYNETTDNQNLNARVSQIQQEYEGISQSNMAINFADLLNGSLGEATSNTITLDNDANGYGWYIDLTPGLNEEFLPTVNPYEWKAKPGSEAEGRIDLLTVLLHEAAHTLGYDHTNDSHALMAPTLEPGIRRLPSAELLAELQGLADQEVAVSMNNPDDPLPMPNPIPFAGFGAFWAGRLRKSGYGYLLESVGVNNDRDIQYAVTPNPTLLNPEFAAVDGWNLTGDVALGGNAAPGQAILTESATAQTRLNQIFTLNEGDRFLRFTLDGIDLDDVNGAPDDAFEVALIDANTNHSLLSDNGLTHSDAAINLQADGSQHLASEVSFTDNGDGSRTYQLDLSGIATGTAVSLSFDLIGFGRNDAATNSQVTLRDLRLGIPETYDDAVTTAEDTALTIDALANDLDADQPGFVPVVVTGPAHGQLAINPDGSFDYTPNENWSGEDSFSYLLSDGAADSNTSMVTITVTPVNDAPLASDAQLTMLEDETLTIDLTGYGSDVDSASLSAQVFTGPAHGVITQNPDGSFSFAANANFHGVDSFTYLISDGDLNSATATVSIDVTSVNDAPTGADNTVTTLEDTAYTFQVADFGFSDVNDGNSFANVIIDQLPAVGSLTLNDVAVTSGQTVSVTDIEAGHLRNNWGHPLAVPSQ